MMDAQVMQVVEEMEDFQRDRSDAWNVPREQALVMHAVALAGRCRHLVEVGTSYGFSGLFLAAAARANGGTLHTFEKSEDKHAHARDVFARAGLADTVRLHTGDALEALAGLADGIDFAFLDATKTETRQYWGLIEGKLAPHCIIAVDNTSTHPEQLGEFVTMLRDRDDFFSCDVPAGHGFELAVRPG